MVTIRQFVVNADKQLFQFQRDLDDWREHDHKRAVLLAGRDLPDQRLHDLGGLQEPVKILEHQQGRTVRRRQGIERLHGRQRILAAGLLAAGRLTGLLGAAQAINTVSTATVGLKVMPILM